MTRSEAFPEIPTISEFVPGYEAISLFGIGAPKDTPSEIVDKPIQRLTQRSVIPKLGRALPTWAARYLRARLLNSASFSPTKPRSGEK